MGNLHIHALKPKFSLRSKFRSSFKKVAFSWLLDMKVCYLIMALFIYVKFGVLLLGHLISIFKTPV